MRFVKLDITNKNLQRVDFIGQANSLFVLPDNLPDFRVARNELETSQNRGGLAAVMRPYKVGQQDGLPLYDVNIVGVPTVSFDPKEPLTTNHITEAFVSIYRLLNLKKFNQLVVPFKNGQPAFGGGVAGALPVAISKAINTEFTRLEQFLMTRDLSKLPKVYQAALLEGPLPVKRTPQTLIERAFDKAYPKVSLLGRLAISAAIAAKMVVIFGATFIIPIASFLLTFAATTIFLKGFFGKKIANFAIKDNRDWCLKKMEFSGGLSQALGLAFPYKVRLVELENELSQQLSALDNNPKHVKILTTRYVREIANSHSEFFYRDDLDRVNTPLYFKKLK